jgi:ribonuclease P protein component
VLPVAARVHSRRDHRTVARTGRRVRRGAVLVLVAEAPEVAGQARAAVVAGRRVGPAVVRNRVKRRLRAALAEQLPEVPDGRLIVVRALPGSADASYAQLAGWLRSGLASAAPRTRVAERSAAVPVSSDG